MASTDRLGRNTGLLLLALWITGITGITGITACQGDGELGADDAELQSWFGARAERERYIVLSAKDRLEQDALGWLVSIDRIEKDRVFAYASPAQLERLKEKGFAYTVLPHPGFNLGARMGLFDRKGALLWNHYPTYTEYVQVMQRFAADYPDLCRLHDLGPTTNKVRPHRLLALEISDHPGIEEDEPEVLLTSSMHGDETVGMMNLLRLAEELLGRYGTDSAITTLVDGLEIWINPAANPDGTYFSGDQTVNGAIRSFTKADGTTAFMDPNRNYPDPGSGDHADGNRWWLETETMMALAAAQSFNLAANFHGGSEVVNYPWDHKQARHPDDAWYIELSRAYADLCQADGPAGYMTDLDNGITDGYDWYVVHGGRQDYMNFWHSCREVTIELSQNKNPPASTLEGFWNSNRRALLGILGSALRGIRGLVTEEGTGVPLSATVEVLGHDIPAEHTLVSTDPEVGNYHRMLPAGTYTLRFSAPGYEARDVAGIAVASGPATRVDVALARTVRLELRGRVTDLRGSPIPGALVEFLGTDLAPLSTSRSGTFQLDDFSGGLYRMRVSRPGFETTEQDRTIRPDATQQDFTLRRTLVTFTADFEASAGEFLASGTPAPGFEWGETSADVGAHSGRRVFGAVLAGDYAPNARYTLELRKITVPATRPRLSFWHAYATEAGFDGGNLSISLDGLRWSLLVPDGGYPEASVQALGGAGYTGASNGFVQASFDLAAWAGQTIILRWNFASDGATQGRGWSLDDVAVSGTAD